MIALVVAHLIGGLALVATGRRLGRIAFPLAAAIPAATTGWAITHAGDVLDGHRPAQVVRWVPDLHLDLAVRLDGFSLVMVLVVSVVASLVLLFAWSYFDHASDRPLARLAGLLLVFTGAMVGVVVASNLPTLFVVWNSRRSRPTS